MQFTIGAWKYDVRRRWGLSLDGEAVDGYAASSIRCIYLDGDLDDAGLVATLRHEHAHAWEFEVGTPATAEDRASFTATVGAAFELDFMTQGGIDALKALPIEGTRPTRSPRQMNNARFTDRIECGRCGAAIMCGSIASEEPKLLGGMQVIPRGCQCPVCESVQTWEEKGSDEGVPMGEYLNVRILDGAEREAWLRDHADLHCPYQV